MERAVEIRDHAVPLHVSLGDLVEILLHFSCEVVVENILEVAYKIVSHDHSDILRKKAVLFCSSCLGLYRCLYLAVLEDEIGYFVLFSCLVSLDYITSCLCESCNGRRVG